MSRKLHLFNEEQQKFVHHQKRTDEIRGKKDNNIKIKTWITEKKY